MTENTQRAQKPAEGQEPRIYVACLAAYNNGCLHGQWIRAEQETEDIQAEISEMLKGSPILDAEEWAIHDYEGFEGAEISEYASIKSVAELAAFVCEHGSLGGKLLQHFCGDIEQAEGAFENYAGLYSSLADYAQALIEETIEIPERLANYIDYEAIARDMELGGEVFTIELSFEKVHVFWVR
ncbi:antirestriction protein [Roseibium algicola]|uniref:Antirestriction protein n=1 Tax=Roseibium algicola TaxID=2857014 RepID=A0ABM6I502_9HYPH|nr:antirestriction protein ArdA [Roseibium aggregatum]AQQ05396.1 antirestriction protein [Roseibium aggregatum]